MAATPDLSKRFSGSRARRQARFAERVALLRRFRFVTTNQARDRVIALTADAELAAECGAKPYPRAAGVTEYEFAPRRRFVRAALAVMRERGWHG